MRLVDGIEDLEGQPALLHVVEEGSGADAVVQIVPDVLTEQNGGFLCQGGFLEGQAVLAGVQADLQLLQLLLVAGQRQRRVLDGKHFDNHQALTVFGPGHLEEAGAAQTLVVLMVVDVGEVTVHREDLRGGDARQLIPHHTAARVCGEMTVKSSEQHFSSTQHSDHRNKPQRVSNGSETPQYENAPEFKNLKVLAKKRQ